LQILILQPEFYGRPFPRKLWQASGAGMSDQSPKVLLPGAKTMRCLLYLCGIQVFVFLAMFAVFFNSLKISHFGYAKLSFLTDYIPVLWRYQTLFLQRGWQEEFPIIFCIYLFFILAQIGCLLIIAVYLFPLLDVRSRWNSPLVNRVAAYFGLLLCVYVNVDLIVGPYDLLPADFFSLLFKAGNYSGLVFRSFSVPGLNLSIVLILFMQFGKFDPQLLRPSKTKIGYGID
jgi:hypothetical protein